MSEELERLKRALAQAQELNRVKDQQIINLNSRVVEVQDQLEILQRERPKLSPEKLADSFRLALEKMQTGLDSGESRVNYIINSLDVELKTAFTLDDKRQINFQLPKVEDTIPLENLSLIRMSILPVPKPSTSPVGTREVPGVIGLPKDKAVEVLVDAGFKSGVVTERISSSPAGMVIAQDPERYSHAPTGTTIDLMVSKPRETEVPNLIGLTRDDALEALKANRLLLGEITEQESASPPGTVIQQSIKAGVIIAVDSPVDLVLAKKEMVKIPNIVGKMLPAVRQVLRTSKLKTGKVSEKISSKPRGMVLDQNPNAGRRIPVGSPVDMVVSSSRRVNVPDLSGMKHKEAERVLKEAGLVVGRVLRRRSRKPDGTIIGQKPAPGEKFERGASVNLTFAYPGRT